MPSDRLLVWNVKDGWEPLCSFLNHPIPTTPIPHDNKTGDQRFMENYIYKSQMWAEARTIMMRNLAAAIIAVAILIIYLQQISR